MRLYLRNVNRYSNTQYLLKNVTHAQTVKITEQQTNRVITAYDI